MAAQNLAYRKLSRVFFFLVLVFAVFWMVLTSIRPDNDIRKFPPTVIPKALTIPTIITFVFAWQEFMFASTINKKNN